MNPNLMNLNKYLNDLRDARQFAIGRRSANAYIAALDAEIADVSREIAKATPVNAHDAFIRNPSPANAVRLALEDHRAYNNGRGVADFEAQLARAIRILDAFEEHRFTLQLALDTLATEAPTHEDAAADVKQALIDAVA